MANPETTFIESIHRHLPVDLYRMKNHNMYNAGIADCWYSGLARDLWTEYKFILTPARDTTVIRPDLSKLQLQWLQHREREGRNVAVIIGCKEGGVYLHPHQWESLLAGDFRRQTMPRKLLAAHIERFVNSP